MIRVQERDQMFLKITYLSPLIRRLFFSFHRFGFRTHEPEREKGSFGRPGQDPVSVWVSTTCAARSVGLCLR